MAYTDTYHNVGHVFSALTDEDIFSLECPRSLPPPLPPRRPTDVLSSQLNAASPILQRPNRVQSDGIFGGSYVTSTLPPVISAGKRTPASLSLQHHEMQTTPPPLPPRTAPPLPTSRRQHFEDVDSGFSTYSSSSSKRTPDHDDQSIKSNGGDSNDMDAASNKTMKVIADAAADVKRRVVKFGKRMKVREQVKRTPSVELDHSSGGSGEDVTSNRSFEKTADKFKYRQSFDELRQKVTTPMKRLIQHKSANISGTGDGDKPASLPRQVRRARSPTGSPQCGSFDIQQPAVVDSVPDEAEYDGLYGDSSFDDSDNVDEEDVNNDFNQPEQDLSDYANESDIKCQMERAATKEAGKHFLPISDPEMGPSVEIWPCLTPSISKQTPTITQPNSNVVDLGDLEATRPTLRYVTVPLGSSAQHCQVNESSGRLTKPLSYEDLMIFEDKNDKVANSGDSDERTTLTAKLKALLSQLPTKGDGTLSKPPLTTEIVDTQRSYSWPFGHQVTPDNSAFSTTNASEPPATIQRVLSVQQPSSSHVVTNQRPSTQSSLLPNRPLPPVPVADSRHPGDTTPVPPPLPSRVLLATSASTMDVTPTAPPPEEPASFIFNQQAPRPSVASVPSTIGQQTDPHQYAWYFGSMSREMCENQLHGVSQNGAFIVRKSKTWGPDYPYAISVYCDGRVYHLLVRLKANDKYALGLEKANEQDFETMADLVTFHRRHAVFVDRNNEQKGVLLTISPAKLN